MTHLSTQTYKGTRDYVGKDMRIRNYIFETWRRAAQSFGYQEYACPLLEPLEMYAAKSGEEIVNEQSYSFHDRGGRVVMIRPEMTPSVSRVVAGRRQELSYPARLYSIANFMRYERPQRGREREFWQLNVDLFGADTVAADAEMIQMGIQMLQTFGATPEMYVVRVNSREVITAMMQQYLGLNDGQTKSMMRLFDKKSKVTAEQFRDEAQAIFMTVDAAGASTGLTKIAQIITARQIQDLPAELRDSPAAQRLDATISMLEDMGYENVLFDCSLMRGFEYYTGIVFEFFDNHPQNNRALFGGGRYDGLVTLFGAEPLSAVGFAPGLTPMELFLASHDLLPTFQTETDVVVIVLGEDAQAGASEVAQKLREEGIMVAVDVTNRKIDKQIKSALKLEVPYLLFIGTQEIAAHSYNLKDVRTATEQTLSFERIVSVIRANRPPQEDLV